MYQALYRKWRPRRFCDVIGQAPITNALANQIMANKIGHAYIFTGTRGTGKTSCAKIFAAAVNCENRDGAEPCGQCALCVGMANGSILDVAEIDAASNNGVDNVRELREETIYRPSRGQYRVYIIDEVHMLSSQAFNALLKILEEPPSHVIFILATTEIHKVPATILSRCQRFDFMRVPASEIAQRLLYIANEEDIALTQNAAALIARMADGAVRDALSLLDTCAASGKEVDEELVREMAGVGDKSYLFAISDAVINNDAETLMKTVAQLYASSIDMRRLCEELVLHYRNMLLVDAKKDGSLLDSIALDDTDKYIEAVNGVSAGQLVEAVRRLAKAMDGMARSLEPRVELELALYDLCDIFSGKAIIQQQNKQVPSQKIQEHVQEAKQLQKQAPIQVLKQVQPTSTQDVKPFEQWAEVLTKLSQDRLLSSSLKDSTAYLSDNRVLIDAGEMFLEYVRKNDYSKELIKKTIEEVTGKRYGIGPYEGGGKNTEEKKVSAEDTIKKWQEKGVEINYE